MIIQRLKEAGCLSQGFQCTRTDTQGVFLSCLTQTFLFFFCRIFFSVSYHLLNPRATARTGFTQTALLFSLLCVTAICLDKIGPSWRITKSKHTENPYGRSKEIKGRWRLNNLTCFSLSWKVCWDVICETKRAVGAPFIRGLSQTNQTQSLVSQTSEKGATCRHGRRRDRKWKGQGHGICYVPKQCGILANLLTLLGLHFFPYALKGC